MNSSRESQTQSRGELEERTKRSFGGSSKRATEVSESQAITELRERRRALRRVGPILVGGALAGLGTIGVIAITHPPQLTRDVS